MAYRSNSRRQNRRSSVTDTFEGTCSFGVGLLARAFSGDDQARCEFDDRRGIYVLSVDGRRLGAVHALELVREIEKRWGDSPAAADLEMVGSGESEAPIETVGSGADDDVNL